MMTFHKKTLGVLLRDSFSIYSRNITTLIQIVFVVYIPLFILSALTVHYQNLVQARKIFEGANFVLGVQALLFGFSIFIITIILTMLYQIAVIRAINLIDYGRDFDLKVLYAEAWGMLGGYFKVTLWVLLKVFLWSLLFVIPGIVFGIFYSYAGLACIVDGKEGIDALVLSKKMIKPSIWKFLGNTIMASLVVLPVYLLISVVINMFFGNPAATAMVEGSNAAPVIGSMLANLMSIVISIYPTIFFYLLYKELQKGVDMSDSIRINL